MYDPDEFEDNNPFAEPSNVPSHEPSVQESPVPTDSYEPQESQPPIQQSPQTQEDQVSEEGTLTEQELRSLVPERFISKSKLAIKLTAIEKNKIGNPILKFDATVENLPKYRQSKYKDIRRTYHEVEKFNKYLTISNLECFVPQIPSINTSYPTGGEDETKLLFNSWQHWFNRITKNPIIMRDPEFVYFIENDFGYSVINASKKTPVATGLVRKTMKQLAPPYDPYTELAEFRPLIKACFLSCQKLEKLLDRSSKTERLLATAIGDLSQKLYNLSQVEYIHPGMKNMWEKLGKIKLIEADLTLVQLLNDNGTLGDGLRILVEDFYQIKEALTNRHFIMKDLVQAQQQKKLKQIHANKIKNKSSLDPIKVDEALRSLEAASINENSLSLQVKRVSGEMQFEKDEIISNTEVTFHKLLKTFTLAKVDHHRKILKHLENIRLDIRIVDDKGGLSRLNRENLSNLKHNLSQSQSANGDSWSSRTFRSLNDSPKKQNESEVNGGETNSNENQIDPKNAANLLGVAIF